MRGEFKKNIKEQNLFFLPHSLNFEALKLIEFPLPQAPAPFFLFLLQNEIDLIQTSEGCVASMGLFPERKIRSNGDSLACFFVCLFHLLLSGNQEL